jgi:phage-related protein
MSYDLGTAYGTIELDYDGGIAAEQAQRDIDKVGDEAKKSERQLKSFSDQLDSVFKGLTALGKGAGILALSGTLSQAVISAGALAIQLLGAVPPLASMLSFASTLPALLAGAALSAGVLAAAFAGVEDALSAAISGDAEEFAEAIEKLSPAARSFAESFRDAMPAIKAVQQGIQEAFFGNAGLESSVRRGVAQLQTLRPVLEGIAARFGGLTAELVRVGTSAQSLEFVTQTGLSLQRVLDAFKPAIEPLISGLTAAGAIGLPVLEGLGAAVAQLAVNFGDWLNRIAETGQLSEWLSTAIATAQTLGNIVLNLGQTIGTVFGIANSVGGSFLDTLELLTNNLLNFVQSAEGSRAIATLFQTISAAASTLVPVVLTLVGALVNALGPAIIELAATLGPVLLETVNALAPAFGPVAQGILAIAQAVSPLLPLLGQLVAFLGTYLGGVAQVLAATLGPLIELIAGGLTQAFAALMPVITELFANGLPLAIEAGLALASAFEPLVPLLVQLATTLASSLLPVLPEIQQAVGDGLIPAITEFATALSGVLADGLQRIIPMIPILVQGFVALVPVIIAVYTTGLQLLTWLVQFSGFLASIPGAIFAFGAALVSGFVNAITGAYNAVITFGGMILAFFQALPGQIMSFVSSLPGLLAGWAMSAINGALFAFGYGIGLIIKLVTQWIPTMMAAIAGLPAQLGALAQRAWTAVVNFFTSGINSAVNLAQSLPGRVSGAVSSLVSLIGNTARSAWDGAVNAFSNGVSRAVSLAQSLPGRIAGAVGGLGSLLYGAGRDAIQGLINGIGSLVDAAAGAARAAAQRVADGIKSALKIGSPSRLLFQYGAWTTEGFINGLKSLQGQLSNVAETLAGTAIAPTAMNAQNSASYITNNNSTTYSGTSGGPGVTFNQTVNAIPGMDSREVATYSARKFLLAMNTGVDSFAVPLSTAAM